jgi:hypothetical protein
VVGIGWPARKAREALPTDGAQMDTRLALHSGLSFP